MKRIIALITAGFAAMTLWVSAGAVHLSDTNKDIDIVHEEFTGYRFYGPDAPYGNINTSRIATLKFYIKCPDLESIENAIVQLAYNSGTTTWVETEHDLNDGLIVDIDIPGVVEGDFFDAMLSTWNEQVWGTFSVEVLDAQGNVLGQGVYVENAPGITEHEETGPKDGTVPPKDGTEPPKDGTTAPETSTSYETQPTTQVTEFTVAGAQETEEEIITTAPEVTVPEETTTTTAPPSGETVKTPPPTGSSHIITATVMTALSAWAIISMRKKKD